MRITRILLGLILVGWAGAVHAADLPKDHTGPPDHPSVLLITLDTTRADILGCFGDPTTRTPVIDAVATRGTRYEYALTPVPLTLPAHASLLTGLLPPEHGLRTNGGGALPASIPTLATVLSERGYASAAVIGSRVLDHRFGLDRGFSSYDDRMPAENLGEYGYPERRAEAVTSAALEWLGRADPDRPFFLWVHYYDPHAPYEVDEATRPATPRDAYRQEIERVDREIGRLFRGLPGPVENHLVTIVGDHGESLGAHGERTHGIFLYREVLEVPLILAGPGVEGGRVVHRTVGIRGLASTLLRTIGAARAARAFGAGLEADAGNPVFSESRMPLAAYGWAPLEALTTERWRLIAAPRPELYDRIGDPAEQTNLAAEQTAVVKHLTADLAALKAGMREEEAGSVTLDAELAESLQALGYVSTQARTGDGIDPKDGMEILRELDGVRRLLARGHAPEALRRLEPLVQRNPSNIPLLTKTAQAQLATGHVDAALATYRRAITLDPDSVFLKLNLAHALRDIGRIDDARTAYKAVLAVDRRNAPAWIALAGLARAEHGASAEAAVLRSALEAGLTSTSAAVDLARIDLAAGHADEADRILSAAVEWGSDQVELWSARTDVALALDQPDAAEQYCRRAAEFAPASAAAALCSGAVALSKGKLSEARGHFRRAQALGRGTPDGEEAARRMEGMAGKKSE